MAKPIKETPILEGADAEKFMDNMESNKDKKLSSTKRETIRSNFAKLNAIMTQ